MSSPEVGTRLPFIAQHVPSKAVLGVGSLERSYGKDMQARLKYLAEIKRELQTRFRNLTL